RHHGEIQERIVRSLEGVGGPAEQIGAIIEAFMRWRAELGPLGRVLDQEARSPGSRVLRHRDELIDTLAAFTGGLLAGAGRGPLDPVFFRGLVGALETIADQLLQTRPVREEVIARATRVAFRLVAGALSEAGDALPPIPAPPGKP